MFFVAVVVVFVVVFVVVVAVAVVAVVVSECSGQKNSQRVQLSKLILAFDQLIM